MSHQYFKLVIDCNPYYSPSNNLPSAIYHSINNYLTYTRLDNNFLIRIYALRIFSLFGCNEHKFRPKILDMYILLIEFILSSKTKKLKEICDIN